jgi:hypothetical protein
VVGGIACSVPGCFRAAVPWHKLQRQYSIDAHVTSPRTKTWETPKRNGGNENWLPKTG